MPVIPRADLVTVAEPEDPIHRSVTEDALEEAGMPFLVQNAEVQDLFGAKALGRDSGSPDLARGKAWAGIVLGLAGLAFWYFVWGDVLTDPW